MSRPSLFVLVVRERGSHLGPANISPIIAGCLNLSKISPRNFAKTKSNNRLVKSGNSKYETDESILGRYISHQFGYVYNTNFYIESFFSLICTWVLSPHWLTTKLIKNFIKPPMEWDFLLFFYQKKMCFFTVLFLKCAFADTHLFFYDFECLNFLFFLGYFQKISVGHEFAHDDRSFGFFQFIVFQKRTFWIIQLVT